MAHIWSPNIEQGDDLTLIAHIEAMTYEGRQPLHESQIEMLGDLSKRLLQETNARRSPQYVALGYWLRPAALKRLSASLRQGTDVGQTTSSESVRAPRGIALHLPPTNVDTIFVYSWAISVLAGNANIVRLAERLAPETEWLVSLVARVVADHSEAHRHIFCHYPYGGETEQAITRHCDLRMIWGGDAKVESVSRIPIRPDGLSIGFPDRKSLAIIATDAYRTADTTVRDKLAASFFNDVFWFDQMGCGSPRLIAWLGEPAELAADFYGRLNRTIAERAYAIETGTVIEKFVTANDLLAQDIVTRYTHLGNALDVCRTVDPTAAMTYTRGGGFLCEWVAKSVEDIPPIISRKIQTITHFGVPPEDLQRLAQGISGRGGYRIVPVGEALQFDSTWDGINLFEHMTRRIVIR